MRVRCSLKHHSSQYRHTLIAFGTALVLSSWCTRASHAALLYEATGGQITGRIGGLSFTNASWVVRAEADPANVIGPVTANGITGFGNAVQPKLTITDATTSLTASLLDNGFNPRWYVASLSGQYLGQPGVVNGFFLINALNATYSSGFFTYATGTTGSTDLKGPFTFSGLADVDAPAAPGGTSTSLGLFQITGKTNGPATFSVRDLPATPTPMALLGASAAFGWSRRLRRRVTVSAAQRIGPGGASDHYGSALPPRTQRG